MATKVMQSSDLQQILELADSHSLALRSAEAASALIELTHALPHVKERQLAARLVSAGRRLATPEAVGLLLDDEDPGVRFAAATGLGPYALARRAARETDLETKAACEAALSRRVVSLRSA